MFSAKTTNMSVIKYLSSTWDPDIHFTVQMHYTRQSYYIMNNRLQVSPHPVKLNYTWLVIINNNIQCT